MILVGRFTDIDDAITTGIHGFAKSSRLCRESNKKLSAKKALPRAKGKTPAKEKTLVKVASLPRAY
jgi:hypothetical protein